MISLSDAVIHEIRKRREQAGAPGQAVRIGFQPGGCSGLEYTFAFDSEYAADEVLLRYEDLVFVCSSECRQALQGLKLDFCDALAGGGFKFDNPNAERTCGCGASFRLPPDPSDPGC